MQRLSDSSRVHQIHFRPGLRPGPRWGSLQRSQDPYLDLRGPTSKGGEGREGKGEGWEGKGREGGYSPQLQLLDPPLITNRKSHTGFRLAPTSMTLNDLERCNSLYFAFFFTEFDRFSGRSYITVVEDRHIMSVKYCL